MNDVARVNDRLKAAGVPVRVRLKGANLALRATLPKKPEHGAGQKQYDISLKVPQTKDGLRRIEREAHKLAQRMAEGSFEWSMYTSPAQNPQTKPIGQWVDEFKSHYLSCNNIKESTWANNQASTFRKLPQNEPLKESLLLAVVFDPRG